MKFIFNCQFFRLVRYKDKINYANNEEIKESEIQRDSILIKLTFKQGKRSSKLRNRQKPSFPLAHQRCLIQFGNKAKHLLRERSLKFTFGPIIILAKPNPFMIEY